eukprot:scaffold24399_cov36-Tisochrysis_lutea.AAC.2
MKAEACFNELRLLLERRNHVPFFGVGELDVAGCTALFFRLARCERCHVAPPGLVWVLLPWATIKVHAVLRPKGCMYIGKY